MYLSNLNSIISYSLFVLSFLSLIFDSLINFVAKSTIKSIIDSLENSLDAKATSIENFARETFIITIKKKNKNKNRKIKKEKEREKKNNNKRVNKKTIIRRD